MTGSIDFAAALRSGLKPEDAGDVQRRLAAWNHERFAIQTPNDRWRDALDDDHDMALIEGAFLEQTRKAQAARAAKAPSDAHAFVAWFEELERTGPGQHDVLFPWLAEHATLQDMRWFLEQEVAGEAGFDDLVALAQIKAPQQAKLELARNYWDEMGRGNPKGMHGPMLSRLAEALDIKPTIEGTLAPAHALGNTMIGLAVNRRYFYQALGALGAIELTAPGRAVLVAKGLKRLSIGARTRQYFDLHAVLDVKHSEAWNREIFLSLVAADPKCARHIAEGALMRLACGEACFDAYRAHFWGGDGSAPPH